MPFAPSKAPTKVPTFFHSLLGQNFTSEAWENARSTALKTVLVDGIGSFDLHVEATTFLTSRFKVGRSKM